MGFLSSIFAGLGGALSSRSNRRAQERADKESARRQRELLEFQSAQRRQELEAERRWQLEDRRYRQEAMGNYAQFSPNQYQRPELSDTTPTPVGAPQVTGPTQKGLLSYR